MLVFEKRGKPEYPEKKLSEQGREPTTNSTHISRRVRESNPGDIGGRRVLSPLRHPCSPYDYFYDYFRRSTKSWSPLQCGPLTETRNMTFSFPTNPPWPVTWQGPRAWLGTWQWALVIRAPCPACPLQWIENNPWRITVDHNVGPDTANDYSQAVLIRAWCW